MRPLTIAWVQRECFVTVCARELNCGQRASCWCADLAGTDMQIFSKPLDLMLLMDIFLLRFRPRALYLRTYYPTSLRSMLRYIPGMLAVHHPEQQGSSIAFLNRGEGGQ